MGKLRLGGEGQPAVWVENQKDVSSSVACPRQVRGWVWEGWGWEQGTGDFLKDRDRKAAQYSKSGSLPRDPASHTAPAPGTVPASILCSGPHFLERGCRAIFRGSLGTLFIKQVPLLFGRVSGQDVSLWALLTCWHPCPLSGPTMKTPSGQAATMPRTTELPHPRLQ